MRTIRLIVAAAVLLCSVLGVAEISRGDTYLQGVGNDHARSFKHDRFYSEDDKAFHAAAYDFSGVGTGAVNGYKWATMISPRYFLSSAHYMPGNGSTLAFYEGNTTESGEHIYTVAGGLRVDGTDLWLGRLTADILPEDNITYYPVLALASESDYIGSLVYTVGRPNRIGLNNIDWIIENTTGGYTGRVMQSDFDAAGGAGESEAYLRLYDSGGPSFIVWNGALALVGIHWSNWGSYAPYDGKRWSDTFLPYYIDQLNDNMDFGQSVTTVPEPVSVVLLSLGAIGLLRRRR